MSSPEVTNSEILAVCVRSNYGMMFGWNLEVRIIYRFGFGVGLVLEFGEFNSLGHTS